MGKTILHKGDIMIITTKPYFEVGDIFKLIDCSNDYMGIVLENIEGQHAFGIYDYEQKCKIKIITNEWNGSHGARIMNENEPYFIYIRKVKDKLKVIATEGEKSSNYNFNSYGMSGSYGSFQMGPTSSYNPPIGISGSVGRNYVVTGSVNVQGNLNGNIFTTKPWGVPSFCDYDIEKVV